MAAPKNNKFWLKRSSHGRDKKFSSETLWDASVEYFEYTDENPLYEAKLMPGYKPPESKTNEANPAGFEYLPKMRAMTLQGLWFFLRISKDTWYNYKENDDFIEVVTRIEQIIYENKFSGAAAGLLNANIIARDLGLSDKQSITHETPVPVTISSDMTEEELSKAYEEKRKQNA